MSIEQRLAELGIELPQAAAPVAAYVSVVVAGGLVHVSGQLPFIGGQLVTGRLGENVSTEDGAAAARACGLMILAQINNRPFHLLPLRAHRAVAVVSGSLQTQSSTRLRGRPLALLDHMLDRPPLLRRAYHFFEFTSLSICIVTA